MPPKQNTDRCKKQNLGTTPWFKHNHERFNQEIELVERYYPNLQTVIDERKGLFSWKGIITLLSPKFRFEDDILIRIDYPKQYPPRILWDIPTVFELNSRFPKTPENHINPDGSFCLALPIRRRFNFSRPEGVLDFLDNVSDFLRKQLIFEATGKWPGEDEPHGGDAIREFKPELKSWQHTPRNALCPCGSGIKFKRCHMLIINDLRKLANQK